MAASTCTQIRACMQLFSAAHHRLARRFAQAPASGSERWLWDWRPAAQRPLHPVPRPAPTCGSERSCWNWLNEWLITYSMFSPCRRGRMDRSLWVNVQQAACSEQSPWEQGSNSKPWASDASTAPGRALRGAPFDHAPPPARLVLQPLHQVEQRVVGELEGGDQRVGLALQCGSWAPLFQHGWLELQQPEREQDAPQGGLLAHPLRTPPRALSAPAPRPCGSPHPAGRPPP